MTSVGRTGFGSLDGDFRSQADFVMDAAWRLLAMQDDNAMSPTHGCFHYPYWRDKTSEFPDARFQEAGATLGLLALPYFDEARGRGAASPAALSRAFSAAIGSLGRQQYADGSYDEWYKGERGFAVTEFTTIAYGLAARFLGDRISGEDRQRLEPVIARAGGWLSRRHDRVKANHEAAAAAALAVAGEITGDSRLKTAARLALEDVLARQHDEGWFPEVGGMDLGYCSVLLDYVMIYTLVAGDDRGLEPMRRLLAFMLPLLHPDGTISPEMGICLNPYVSRLGLSLLAEYDATARSVVSFFKSRSGGFDSLRPYLADDLRLTRWSHLPIVTALLADRIAPIVPTAEALTGAFPSGWTWRAGAAVGAYHEGAAHVYVSAAGGAVVRVFRDSELVCDDHGLAIAAADDEFATIGYDAGREVTNAAGGVTVSWALGRVRFFQPGFVSRLLLRIGSSTAVGSRLVRAIIDYIRINRKTATNQSAAPFAQGAGPFRFTRHVEATPAAVRIVDRLECQDRTIEPSTVRLLMVPAAAALKPSASSKHLRIGKTIDLSSGGCDISVDTAGENGVS